MVDIHAIDRVQATLEEAKARGDALGDLDLQDLELVIGLAKGSGDRRGWENIDNVFENWRTMNERQVTNQDRLLKRLSDVRRTIAGYESKRSRCVGDLGIGAKAALEQIAKIVSP